MKRVKRIMLKDTNDNWYDNYNGNQVLIKLVDLQHRFLTDKTCRIWCEGTDDFVLSKDFCNYEEAVNLFEQISQWEFVNHKDLHELGFSPD